MDEGAPAARICCLDLDTFFVSAERLLDPLLEGKPVVVGAAPGQRGVVTACSYEVRAFGVRSGMSTVEARKLAPHAIFLPTRHKAYTPYTKRVQEILERFTPEVRPASIDEFFLDFRGCEALWANDTDANEDATIERTVRAMRVAIQVELGLPASAGVAATRVVAKMASGQAKPAGVRFVPVGSEHAFAAPLPVRRYPGIGPVAEAKLLAAEVHTLGQLLSLPPGELRARFGRLAASVRRGLDGRGGPQLGVDRPAFREHDPRGASEGSISNERTFHADIGDLWRVADQLRALAERVCWRARQRGVRARTITLKLRTADFRTITRARSGHPTHREDRVFACLLELLQGAWQQQQPVRLLGVALSNLRLDDGQLSLPLPARGRPVASSAIDAVRDRFGYDAIRLGAVGRPSTWLA